REHFQEHAVQGGLRRQHARQVVLQIGQQLVAALGADPQRRVGFLGDLAQVGGYGLVLGHDQRHRLVGGDLVHHFPALARIQPVQEVQLLRADDLDLVRVDDIEVADQRRTTCLRRTRFEHARLATHAGHPTQRHALVDAVVELPCADPIQAEALASRDPSAGLRGVATIVPACGRTVCSGENGPPMEAGRPGERTGGNQPYWRSSRASRWCLSATFSRCLRNWATSLSNSTSMEAYMSASVASACRVPPTTLRVPSARCWSLSRESTITRLLSLSSRRVRRSSLAVA